MPFLSLPLLARRPWHVDDAVGRDKFDQNATTTAVTPTSVADLVLITVDGQCGGSGSAIAAQIGPHVVFEFVWIAQDDQRQHH